MTDLNDSTLNRTLYELGFLDKKGNPERDKDRRWKVGLNQAELIIKDSMKNNMTEEQIERLIKALEKIAEALDR